MICCYLTHPQVGIDPTVPVSQWSLARKGRERLSSILDRPWLRAIRRIVSSDERKAIESAELIATAIGIEAEVAAEMGENDRSSTGFLDSAAFEDAADLFFAQPRESWNGWERAIDAQRRIVSATERVLAAHDPARPLLLVGHGAVGTLLKCHIGGLPIGRVHDQPAGGGNVFAFGLAERRLLCNWIAMEDFEG